MGTILRKVIMGEFDLFIMSFTDDEMKQCLRDWALFEEQGFIGECVLRSKATTWTDNYGTSIVNTMQSIAFRIALEYAHRYLQLQK